MNHLADQTLLPRMSAVLAHRPTRPDRTAHPRTAVRLSIGQDPTAEWISDVVFFQLLLRPTGGSR